MITAIDPLFEEIENLVQQMDEAAENENETVRTAPLPYGSFHDPSGGLAATGKALAAFVGQQRVGEPSNALTCRRTRPAMEMSNEATQQEMEKVPQDRTDELIRLRAQVADLESRFRAHEQAKDSAIASLTAGYGKLNEQVVKITGDVTTELQATSDQTKEFVTQVGRIKNESTQAVGVAKKDAEDVKTMADAVNKENHELTKTIRDLDKQQMDVPAGQIIWVSLPNKTVWINRGRADGLQRQTKFTVYSADSNNAAKAVKKGTIEVVSIDGDHSARARILEDKPDNPIIAGDKVFSALWSPGQRNHFALTGIMNLDGDGRNQLSVVRGLIMQNGGEVDAWLDEQGHKHGRITADTRFIVIGDAPDKSSQEFVKNHGDILRDAERYQVHKMTLSDFRQQMNYQKSSSITHFASGTAPSNVDKQHDKQEPLPVEPDTAEVPSWILSGDNRQVPTYQPPVFSNNPAVFYDLVSYAPAMRTNLADVLAVLEAETPADSTAVRSGKIDDGARRLVERARGAGWQSATIADPHGNTPLTIAFDGTGRYRYERTTSAGLREQVICDGASLWHVYPELGIGARRMLSRFHRQDFARLVPWALPPAEDLAHGADVVSVDQRTVAIVPPELAEPPRHHVPMVGGTTSARSPAFRQNRSSVTHLVFAPDGRLAERQLVAMPSNAILSHESYGADGTVDFVGLEKEKAGGTPAPQRKIQLTPCGAPELKPAADLVVLPLPLRSRQQVLAARKLFSDDGYGSWSEDDALAMIAADLASAPAEMKQIIGQRFFRRGDRRLGFYTLLLSTGQTWNPVEKQAFRDGDPLLVDPLADHPNNPLAKYVAAYLASSRPGAPKDLGDPTQTATHDSSFFGQLAEFHDLWDRWRDGRATQGNEFQQQEQCQRALAFIDRGQPPELAWGLLMAVRGALGGAKFNEFVPAIRRFEAVPGLQYAARYERARALLDSGDAIQAQNSSASSLPKRWKRVLCRRSTGVSTTR